MGYRLDVRIVTLKKALDDYWVKYNMHKYDEEMES